MSDSLIIIPTYNEKENIEKIIRKVFSLEKSFHILIIDDGSPDGTASIAKTLQKEYSEQLHIEERTGKLGLGTAYIHGFKWAISKNRIIYLDQLSESELRKAWKKIGVLVSMAPVESYGRVIRESLIVGVPVWATPSAGVKDLMDNCKKGEVKLLDLNKSDASLDKDFKLFKWKNNTTRIVNRSSGMVYESINDTLKRIDNSF